jgi:chromosome segregation ATPase
MRKQHAKELAALRAQLAAVTARVERHGESAEKWAGDCQEFEKALAAVTERAKAAERRCEYEGHDAHYWHGQAVAVTAERDGLREALIAAEDVAAVPWYTDGWMSAMHRLDAALAALAPENAQRERGDHA